MRVNADFLKRVVIRPDDYQWVDSPMTGVIRMMLDRIGGEVARATSLVRYAPNTEFKPHTHQGGEEVLVINGRFFDEYGEHPAGSWIRSPQQSEHTPYIRDEDALIFVTTGHLT